MCIIYRIHHATLAALQSAAAGRPLNPNFAANADELQARNSTVISLTMCWRFPGKTGFCQSAHERKRRHRFMSLPAKKSQPTKQTFLTVHGL